MNVRVLNTVAVCVACLLVGCSKEGQDYRSLAELSKRDPAKALEVSKRLSQTTNGVLQAASHLTLGGESNGGCDRVILLSSPLKSLVTIQLGKKLANPASTPGMKIESAWILWLKTGDPDYLKAIFDLVKAPGGIETEVGRDYLLKPLSQSAPKELRQGLKVPRSKPLPISSEQFNKQIKSPGALLWFPV